MENLISEMLADMAKVAALPRVYPAYLASIIKKTLLGGDKEGVFLRIGEIEPIGDCRHAMTVTDFNGTEYRITVEVAPRKECAA